VTFLKKLRDWWQISKQKVGPTKIIKNILQKIGQNKEVLHQKTPAKNFDKKKDSWVKNF